MACGILVPQPGIEPRPLAVKVWSPPGVPGNSFMVLLVLTPIKVLHMCTHLQGRHSPQFEKQGPSSGDLDMNSTLELKDKWGRGEDSSKARPQDTLQRSQLV